MGTITAQAIVNKVQIILQDTTGIRWPDTSELLGWLNDGQREVLVYKPNANVVNKSVALTAGTKQKLPTDGVQLIDVVRNMGTNGTTPGRSVRIAMREILDAQQPDWHAETPTASVKHYMYTPFDPKTFYIYPPSNGTNQVEIIYSGVPADLPTLATTISLDDIYSNALVDYILYRAYSKDSDYAANPERAGAAQAAYTASLTGKTQGEVIVNPNTTAPANPNVTSGTGPR